MCCSKSNKALRSPGAFFESGLMLVLDVMRRFLLLTQCHSGR
jgi:hypothetical protein